jgi:hypothetical protein
MKFLNSNSRMSFVLLAALSLIASGCVSPPVPWNLRVTKATPASVDVDIVGVQPDDKAQLMSMKVDDWWASPPNDVTRKGYREIMLTTNFQGGTNWIVSKDDPIWSKWLGPGGLGVKEIMVIANLPRVREDPPRRKFLPLTVNDWINPVNQSIEIRVQDDRIWVVTGQQVKK